MVETSPNSPNLNLNLKCRSCLAENQDMHHLFNEFDQGLKLVDIFKSTTNFEIEDDVLPPYMCERCTTIMVDFFNFKTIFAKNNDYLKSLYKNQIMESSNTDIKKESSDSEITLKECLAETENNESEEQIIIVNTENEDFTQQDILDMNESKINMDILKCVKYHCKECNEYYLLKTDFQHHMSRTHDTFISDFKNFVSKGISQVAEEIIINDNVESIILQCDKCEENFTTYMEIAEHYKSHKKFVCEHCGARFARKSCLNDHIEMHSIDRRYTCLTCGKAFKRRSVLAKHRRIHTHPRQCVCEICGLRFTDKGTLKTHIKLKHTKERDFQCIICGQWFPLKSTLVKHVSRHNENREREYGCEVCHVAYKDKSSLNRHYLTKHTENAIKPFCSFCGRQYTTKANLEKHIRKHHSSLNIKKPPENSQDFQIC